MTETENRKQISVALSDGETELLDRLRGSIPKGVFLRELLLQKGKTSMTLHERVTRLKEIYLQKSFNQHTDFPLEIGFSRKEELELERMDRSMIGDIVGQITIHGARGALTHFLGLKIRWNEPELSIYGHSGGGPENQWLKDK